MGDTATLKDKVIERREKVEKPLNERFTRNVNRTLVETSYETKKRAYWTEPKTGKMLHPHSPPLSMPGEKYDEEAKT